MTQFGLKMCEEALQVRCVSGVQFELRGMCGKQFECDVVGGCIFQARCASKVIL